MFIGRGGCLIGTLSRVFFVFVWHLCFAVCAMPCFCQPYRCVELIVLSLLIWATSCSAVAGVAFPCLCMLSVQLQVCGRP